MIYENHQPSDVPSPEDNIFEVYFTGKENHYLRISDGTDSILVSEKEWNKLKVLGDKA